MKHFFQKFLIIIFWLLLWQGAGCLIRNPILFATPLQTGRALLECFRTAGFWQVVSLTLLRILLGFSLGLVLGILLAATVRAVPFLEELLHPVIGLMKTVPVVCFVVLLLVWWGSSFLSVAVSFLMVFTAVYFSTLEGLKAIDRKMWEMARVFRLPTLTRIMYLYRPTLKPFLLGSMKNALGLAWRSGVAAEVIGLPASSIGEKLYLAKISLDTAGIFAWTVVVCLLSFLFEKGVLWLAGKAFSLEVSSPAPKQVQASPEKITALGVNKSYGGQKVLEDFSLSVTPGETLWLTWPSGSGKTTFFRLLMGLEKPDSGSITGPGEGCFSVLFQEDRLCEDYSALRNVLLVTGDEGRARELLEALLSPGLLEKPCAALSGGEKRRVALARALAAQGSILILDEPFTWLDQESRERCQALIDKCQGERTLLIASHIKGRDLTS